MSLTLLIALLPLAPLAAPASASDMASATQPSVELAGVDDDGDGRSRLGRRRGSTRSAATPTVDEDQVSIPNPVYGGIGSCTGALLGGCIPIIPGAIAGMFTLGIASIVAIPFVILGAAAGAGVGGLIGAGGGFDAGHLLQLFVTAVTTAGWAGIASLIGAGLGLAIGIGFGAGPAIGVAVGMGLSAALLIFVAMAGAATYATIGGLRLLFDEVLARPEQPLANHGRRRIARQMAF